MQRTKRSVILVAFLVMLYIVPSFFIVNYGPSTILTQPNINKEFSSSEYLDESPYSIDGFSETLESDVFYTPDGFTSGAFELPVTGNGDWYDVLSIEDDPLDGDIWQSSGGEYCQFRGLYPIEGIAYHIYGFAANGNSSLQVPDSLNGGWGLIVNLTEDTDFSWYNGTYFGPFSSQMTTVTFFAEVTGDTRAIVIDYMEVCFYYLPLLDFEYGGPYTNFGTSFTDVTQWQTSGAHVTIETDGDIATIVDDGTKNYVYMTVDVDASLGTYVELRVSGNASWGFDVYTVADGWVNSIISWVGSATFSTYRAYLANSLTDYQITSFRIKPWTSNPQECNIDYLRISPSIEMGWQHDGSTLQGIDTASVSNVTYSQSTDGDILTLGAIGTSGCSNQNPNFQIPFGDTDEDIENTYYPFTHVRYRINSFSGCTISFRWYTDVQRFTTVVSTESLGVWHDLYVNTKGSGGTGSSLMYGFMAYFYDIDEGDYANIQLDYVEAYSIANYTVTMSGAEMDTYCYVTGGTLYASYGTNGAYFQFAQDPYVSIDTTLYNGIFWDSESSDTGLGFNFKEQGNPVWDLADSLSSNWSDSASATVTDIVFSINTDDPDSILDCISIRFVDLHHWRLVDSETIYLDLPEWHLIESVIIIFWMELTTVAIDLFLIIFGLILLPTSTMYLAYSLKHDMNKDKFFYFCVAFMFGIAFFLGGIM